MVLEGSLRFLDLVVQDMDCGLISDDHFHEVLDLLGGIRVKEPVFRLALVEPEHEVLRELLAREIFHILFLLILQ